jgi:hypothetical protein
VSVVANTKNRTSLGSVLVGARILDLLGSRSFSGKGLYLPRFDYGRTVGAGAGDADLCLRHPRVAALRVHGLQI